MASEVMPEGSIGIDDMPDSYVAQDLHNRFKTIFFQCGDYSQTAIAIPFIQVVGPVELDPDIADHNSDCWTFRINTGVHDVELGLDYETRNEAVRDRAKLIAQIEQYHSRGMYET